MSGASSIIFLTVRGDGTVARFQCDGLDDLMERMTSVGEMLNGELADRMLLAGAEKVKEAWKNSAEKHNHRDNGDMIDSIGYASKPSDLGGVRSIDIYPQGTDKKGVRNAEKAFLLHYGWSDYTGSHWIDDADRECDSTVVPAMAAVFDAELAKRG